MRTTADKLAAIVALLKDEHGEWIENVSGADFVQEVSIIIDEPTAPDTSHDALIASIENELDIYGPASLADIVATLTENRYDEDEPKETDDAWRTVCREFADLAERLIGLPHVNPKRGG